MDWDAEAVIAAHLDKIFGDRNQVGVEIPKFFFKKPGPALTDAGGSRASRIKSVREKVSSMARERVLRKKWEDLNNESSLELLQLLLTEHNSVKGGGGAYHEAAVRVDFDDFVKIKSKMPSNWKHYFSADTFKKFRRDQFGRIDSHLFFQYVCRHIALCQTWVQLATYDSIGEGYLLEQDIECYIKDLIPTLPLLSGMHADFQPYYVITAVRKFFFVLDPRRTGKLSIKELITSSVLSELMKLWAITQQQQQQLQQQQQQQLEGSSSDGASGYGDVSLNGLGSGGSSNNNNINELIEEEIRPGRNWFSAQSALRGVHALPRLGH